MMGRRPITAKDVLSHPVRFALLDHVMRCGGTATAMSICRALGEQRRGVLANHASRLAKFGLVTRRISRPPGGGVRELTLAITDKGRKALNHVGGNAAVTNPMEITAP
jgi:hypothetical protein